MAPAFEYETQSRRPITYLAGLLCVGLLLLAATQNAPWYIWAIWGPASAAIAVALIVNVRSGSRIEGGKISLWRGHKSWSVDLDEVLHVTVTRWSEGPDDVTLHLTGGRSLDLPSEALPATEDFLRTLADLGIPNR